MGTLSPRGRHSEVASTTSDDEVKADWPAGGQRPGIPQEEEENEEAENEETANEEAANEEEGAAIENGGGTSEEKGGGNGRRGEPHNPEDNPEDGGRPRCPGTCDDDARGSGVVPEPEGTREQRGDHHRASHGPGGSWLWKKEVTENQSDFWQWAPLPAEGSGSQLLYFHDKGHKCDEKEKCGGE
ncbi:hypothetical protein NDU88_010940 [Pleurodeles waltl]|uniref:Uncharacterized protein n=1 Tax=Pleurodeles waltl TaxID=8319 RepID=A0AAV7R1Q0_PLEWA|nr:hypothetical protein NDU88_010940 [Pleurodeles waltl]